MPYAPTPLQQQPSAPASSPAHPATDAGGSEAGIEPVAGTTSTSAAQAHPGARPPLLLRPAPDSSRRLSYGSFDTSISSEFSLGLGGTGDEGSLGGGGRHGKAVRFGDGAKPNRTATQSMADFLRTVPPPSEVQSPPRSTSSVQEKIRKPVRLFGRHRTSSKSDDVGKTSADRSAERTPPPAQESPSSRGQVKGLQQVITPSGQTVHLIPYRPTPSGGSAPPSSFTAPWPPRSNHHTSSSMSSETSAVPSEASSGPPVLPELRAFSEDEEGASADRRRQPRPSPLGKSARTHPLMAPTGLVADAPPQAPQPARGHSESGSTFLAPPSPDSPQSRRTLSRSTSSPSIVDTVPQIVFPSTASTAAEAQPPSAGSARSTKEALRAQEAITLEMLGQRVERDDQGELVLGRRVSKRTVGAQTNISAVRSLLEMSRERTSTGRSTRSVESSTSVPPSPAVLRATGRLALSASPSTEGSRRRNASVDPDSSIVGGESDDEGSLARSATSASGTFGPSRSSTQSTAPSISSAAPSSPMPPLPAQPPPPRPTPPPLVSSESRGSVSSNASASSWSIHTPSLPAVPATAAFGSLSPAHGNMRKSPSGSRLRPSTAPTGAGVGSEAREREQLEVKVRSVEERLAAETEKRREAERKLKRLQASSREGRARWEDMAAWAVEVIESADKDRHLLGLENARLQRTVELYRNQFGDVEPLPADPTAQPY